MSLVDLIPTTLFRCFNDLRFSFWSSKKNVWEIAMKEQIKWRQETKIKLLGVLKQFRAET